MKNFTLLLLGLCLAVTGFAQQDFNPTHFFYQSELFNPAQYGATDQFRLTLIHQQRHLGFSGLAHGQLLALQSPGIGKNKVFGWGANLQLVHFAANQRLKLNGGVAAHLLKNDFHRLSLGVNLGFNSVIWNYSKLVIFNPADPLATPGSVIDLDATAGVEYALTGKKFGGLFSAAVSQIPGTLFSGEFPGYAFYPQLTVLARGDVFLGDGICLSPQVMYRNLLRANQRFSFGSLDLGARVEFTERGLTAAAGYRWDWKAVHAMVGARLFEGKAGQRLGLSLLFEAPLNNSRIFGPDLELGLNWRFGVNSVN
ncbi:MAG: type IX secretion system membrane protein PorP/SprF [Bacteroidia bacterium]|nr:type IX secretion system membrane protein PorP/SprF [Bacteroidia bacterium]